MMMYSLTGYNFFSHMTLDFDLLSISIFSFFGFSAIILTITFLLTGLNATKKSLRERVFGFLGYIFLFFLYQFFWLSSITLVVLKRKAKWR